MLLTTNKQNSANRTQGLRYFAYFRTLATIKPDSVQNYRDKNFIQFVFSSKIQALMVIILIGQGGVVFALLYYASGTSLFNSILVTLIILLSVYFLAHTADFIRYEKGKKLFEIMFKKDSSLLENIKTYIPNYTPFDLESKKDKLLVNKGGNFKFTQYFFDKSDILISNNSIFLFGYGASISPIQTSYALPVEIERNGFKRYPSSASLISYDITSSKIYLQIKDRSYKKPIKLEFEYREELEVWLTSAIKHCNDLASDNKSS